MKRNTRRKVKLEEDLKSYRELLKRASVLEKDIPPRRPKRSDRVVKQDQEQEQEQQQISEKTPEQIPIVVKLEPVEKPSNHSRSFRNTRSRTKRLAQENVIVKQEIIPRHPQVTRNHTVPRRPKFLSTTGNKKVNQINSTRKLQLQHNNIKPTAIGDIKLHNTNYSNQIQLDHTYSNLINMIKSNISQNNIDIPLINNLVPKNLQYEMNRFHFNDTSASNTLFIPQMSFNSHDIDSFFDFLNGVEKNHPDKLKYDIPLV